MCQCTPNIRTPYCGAIGCEAPKSQGFKAKEILITFSIGDSVQKPTHDIFAIPENAILNFKELDGKQVTLKVVEDGDYNHLFAIDDGKVYLINQTKLVPGEN